ncbi:hypothetical protein CFAEC_07495 [Corynebacterium faecale]|nr:hypothetical protein CFAEC_07495 [Corynebacterium faecale]
MRRLIRVKEGELDNNAPGNPADRRWLARVPRPLRAFFQVLPRLGSAGSRSSTLHISSDPTTVPEPTSRSRSPHALTAAEQSRFNTLRLLGTIGTLMIAFGALGAGALPVVNNPYVDLPGGSFMGRMLQTSSMVVLIGVGLLVLAWVLMAPFTGVSIKRHDSAPTRVSIAVLRRTFIAWVAPIMITAPLFTQDIYSYLAQGSIVAQGMDPYSAGPLELLGPDNHLARSVPFIWAQSPSPYGPIALGVAAVISMITNDSIVAGVFAHRFVSLLGVLAAGWAVTMLARRCRVPEAVAFWLGILNPLLILHLIGGIHNESILLGLILVGLEIGLRGVDSIRMGLWRSATMHLTLSGALISCAGMVKVTGFIALGFIGMAIARELHARGRGHLLSIGGAALIQAVLLLSSVALATLVTGIGLGWITGQGGAASIRSWMSITTDLGIISGFIGMNLGLGDHTTAILGVTRTVGILVAGAFMIRMLFATYRGHIHPLGGLGVSTFILVILFPVVHPWYMLWAIVPLAPWANRLFFQIGVVAYSTAFSFFVLPRGLALPANTIFTIYSGALIGFVIIVAIGWWLMRRGSRSTTFGLH